MILAKNGQQPRADVVNVGHLRFSNDVSQVSAVQSIAHLDHTLEIDLALCDDTLRMNLQNLETARLVGQRNFDLAVQSSSTEKGRVECVGPVGGHDDLSLAEVVETVELVQQLHQCSLNFSICTSSFRETTATDGSCVGSPRAG